MSSRQLYSRLLLQFRPYSGALAVTLFAVGVASLTDVLLVTQLKTVIDALGGQGIVHGAGDAVASTVKDWIGQLLPVSAGQAALWTIPTIIMALAILRMVSSFAGDYGSAWLSNQVQADLREKMFARILRLPNGYFDQSSTGTTLSRVTYDANQVSQAGLNVINVAVRDSVLAIGYLVTMLVYDWQLAVFCLTLLPLVAAVVTFAGRRMRRLSESGQHAMGELTRVLDESIGGQRVVKIFGGQQYEQRRFDDVVKLNRRLAVKQAATAAMNSGIIMMLIGVVLSAVIYFALLRAQANALTAGDFATFMTALLAMQSPVKNLTKLNEPLQRGLAAAKSVFGVIDAPVEMDDGMHTLARASGHIELASVSFRYGAADASPALANVSLDIPAGETVALVGSSGSGKTTLASLLPRFYDVGGGRILLDGVDLRNYRLADLRAQIALVSQDVVLFNDTLAANIAYGDPAPDQARIEAAAQAAYAHEFIVRQPQGYATEVGENGLRLSGGQRQRLAIARALYKDAPILILDEATSALDTESERQVQAALERLMEGRTTVVIAHRLSTIENADRIVVMHAGTIAETGTHEALLAQGGAYARLYQTQKQLSH
ncbi:lipid A export permease/ATP-binding protein MsbA [Pseudoduganella umbonata]|uniref:Lipid A export permease/ATP-binding protein MsbA n=1 Tax=Pseudoduganella umbonata TaxID=864828 RepID=A0A4P8HNW6_9BURK|nr:lipid A export permease/ATP-binding protein MsbA [Pseudoduganella umbonata]MBB3220166.1 subfamily B ATP-binding cassette protein MsbA [Pseudoduganella umbonata]QCP10154.1 lipid A export permease/ATP-binding protein MsbA [Pseudoduganella umbonata]